ncbi:MAG: hypothetical protein M1831_006983 [Alyxoria varia]|nr:MAG: hypothetical protein M1831_006983 [Alyxoria varia]
MRFQGSVAIFLAGASLVAAQPHQRHKHLHERAAAPESKPETVVVYELDGHPVSAAEVKQGIANGTLVWAKDGGIASVPSYSKPTPAPKKAPEHKKVHTEKHKPKPKPSEPKDVHAESKPEPAQYKAPDHDKPSHSKPSYSKPIDLPTGGDDDDEGSPWSHDPEGLDDDFPDGEIDCSEFPSKYGAMSLKYLSLGGWTGIQQPGSHSGGYGDIMTVKSDHCPDGNCCKEGSFCSYACPNGYQKSQWPTKQGATGQSVGGVECKNGKLWLTNKDMSCKLCMKGTEEVSIKIENKMPKSAAVCRTDYPGTEGETIPLHSTPGSLKDLTCPSADNYYNWKGGKTSAQYYVNPAGVPVKDACQWGDSSKPWGNFAPLNLGVGYSNGMAWLSIFQNKPTTDEKLDFTVELVGEDGGYDNLNGRCIYKNGQYCSGENYDDCTDSGEGCTVSVKSGTAKFVFKDCD